ncbi:MAG: hypothetical protein ABFD54_06335 [Armatimonadota bacterium]|nr:hypothetical protein [bacterium]
MPKPAVAAHSKTKCLSAYLIDSLVIVFFALLAHAIAFSTYFHDDDYDWLILARKWTTGLPLFSPNHWNTFRPGTHVLMRISYSLFHDWAPGYHAFSLLLHIAAILLLRAFISRMVHNRAAVLLSTLLFAVGAGHAEGVQWVSAVGFPFAASLSLGALILLDKYLRDCKLSYFICSGACCLCAILTHEFAVWTLVSLFLFVVMSGAKVSRGHLIRVCVVLVAIAAVYGAVYISYYTKYDKGVFKSGEPALISARHIPMNVLKAAPRFISPDFAYSEAIVRRIAAVSPAIAKAATWLWLALSAGLLIAMLWLAASKRGIIRWAALVAILGLILGSTASVGVGGRYLYLPMIAFTLLLAIVLEKAFDSTKGNAARFIALFAVCSVLIFNLLANVVCLVYIRDTSVKRLRLLQTLRKISDAHPGITLVLSGAGKYAYPSAYVYYGIPITENENDAAGKDKLYVTYSPSGVSIDK